jgi:hypothetical protein
MNKSIQIVKNILGEDIFEVLEKNELIKLGGTTTLDPAEIKIALQIVPRAVLGFLIANLKPLHSGGVLELPLPFANATLHVNKISNDVYNGDVVSEGKRITEFKFRSLPGIGLILMSTFELYNVSDLSQEQPDNADKLQAIVDERLKLHTLIRGVVDQRITERDAIQQLINERLSERFEYEDEDEDEDEECEEDFEEEPLHSDEEDSVEVMDDSEEDVMNTTSKKSKLREFLDSKEKKRQESVELDKGEEINCPDCETMLYKGENHFKLCVCFGQFHNKEIKIKKAEDGRFNLKFPKSFDTDNVVMLLDAIKSNK